MKILISLILLSQLTFSQDIIIQMKNNAVVVSADTIPDQFTFTDVTEVSVSSWNQAYIVVAGCDSARFTISSGDSLKLGALGSYGVSAIWADVGDTIYVSQVASASYNTAVVCTLTAGGISDIYSVTTLVTPPYFDQFTDTDYTNNPTWTVSGTWAVSNSVANTIDDNDYALANSTAGVAYVSNSQAYGTWIFDVYFNSIAGGDKYINLISAGTAQNSDGYQLYFNGGGRVQLKKFVSTTASWLFGSGLNEVLLQTWYRFKVVRNETTDQYVAGAKGTFAVYKSTDGANYTLVDDSDTGNNPSSADDTYTTSSYLRVEGEVSGDRYTNIKIY